MECGQLGFVVSQRVMAAKDEDWPALIQELRCRNQLRVAVHEINLLLEHPVHSGLASAALKRIGLAQGG